ncbi:hypothetical protein SNEBB_010081 [Seison nebaliae]|nr:hypothetical protein SNEBB_010081 [Seison nebaliae]
MYRRIKIDKTRPGCTYIKKAGNAYVELELFGQRNMSALAGRLLKEAEISEEKRKLAETKPDNYSEHCSEKNNNRRNKNKKKKKSCESDLGKLPLLKNVEKVTMIDKERLDEIKSKVNNDFSSFYTTGGHFCGTTDELENGPLTEKNKIRLEQRQIIQDYNDELLAKEVDQKDEHAKKVIERTQQLIDNRHVDIAHIDRVINDARINNIRDAQVQEKRKIAEEMKNEELRLDLMMEVDRLNALYPKKDGKSVEERNKEYAEALHMQMEERKFKQLQEENEKIEQGEREKLKYLEYLHDQTVSRLRDGQKKVETAKILKEANRQYQEKKKREIKTEQAIDIEYQEYSKKMADYKEKLEKEKKEQAEQKRLITDQLRKQMEHDDKEKVRAANIREKRALEIKESEWRKTELAKALREKREKEELLQARHLQTRLRNRCLGSIVARDKRDAEIVLNELRAYLSEQERKKKLAKENQIAYRKVLLDQMRLKELEKLEKIKTEYAQAAEVRLKQATEADRFNQIKKQRLKDLARLGISQRYLDVAAKQTGIINDVEKEVDEYESKKKLKNNIY